MKTSVRMLTALIVVAAAISTMGQNPDRGKVTTHGVLVIQPFAGEPGGGAALNSNEIDVSCFGKCLLGAHGHPTKISNEGHTIDFEVGLDQADVDAMNACFKDSGCPGIIIWKNDGI